MLRQGGADVVNPGFIDQAHLLADELHLATLAFKVGDALGLGDGVLELFGQVQPFHQVGAQCQQIFTQLLQLQAFAFEISAALVVRALEFALELQIAFAAFGNELASDEIAFFEFA